MLGSNMYALRARNRGDNIRAVINVDMIGYTDILPETLEVFSDTLSEELADNFIACADTYATVLTRKRQGVVSDEGPFQHYGYMGIGIIDDAHPDVNPYRHSPGDTIGAGFNDLQFCTNSTRAIIAALASRSRPLGIIEHKNSGFDGSRLSIQPNPIRNSGQVKFSLDRAGIIRIKLFDITGRLVRSILNEQKEAGNYQINFDNRGLSQGMYILVMESNFDKKTAVICVIR